MLIPHDHESVSYNAQDHQDLIDYLKAVAPNRIWTNTYFDFVRDLLDSTGLVNSDVRLVLTLPADEGWPYFLPVIINTRYALAAYYWKDNSVLAARYADYDDVVSIGIIFGRRTWESLPQSERDKVYTSSIQVKELMEFYKHIQGEESPPVFLHLKDTSYINDFKSEWIFRSQMERDRFKGSINRQRHRAVVYKAIIDADYRTSVLNEVFP